MVRFIFNNFIPIFFTMRSHISICIFLPGGLINLHGQQSGIAEKRTVD